MSNRKAMLLTIFFLLSLWFFISTISFGIKNSYFQNESVNISGQTKSERFLFGRKIEDIEDYIVERYSFPASSVQSHNPPFNSLENDKSNSVKTKEQFTILIPTHSVRRSQLLFEILIKLSGLPQLNQVIITWNNRDLPDDSELRWPHVDYKLRILHNKRDSLNNRFLPLSIIETEAVLSMDDDVFVSHENVLFAFNVWQEFTERIVGFVGRGVEWENGKWNYVRYSHTVSIVLTNLSFFHKKYLYLYTYQLSEHIKEMIDRIVNCEDIAMNLLVSHITKKPPLKVTTLETAHCLTCENNRTEELSKRSNHKDERSECLNVFAEVYGYLPLFRSNYRLTEMESLRNTSRV